MTRLLFIVLVFLGACLGFPMLPPYRRMNPMHHSSEPSIISGSMRITPEGRAVLTIISKPSAMAGRDFSYQTGLVRLRDAFSGEICNGREVNTRWIGVAHTISECVMGMDAEDAYKLMGTSIDGFFQRKTIELFDTKITFEVYRNN